GLDGLAAIVRVERRVAARLHPAARVEQIVAERDVLTGDIGLVRAAAVVAADHARVGGRALGPVDPAVLEGDLLRRMVAGRQLGDERRHLAVVGIHDDDARAVVLFTRDGGANGL